MRPLVIVVVKPLIQVRLEHLHRGIELLSEGLPEELVEDRPVEPLHEAVGPGPGHLGSTMLDLAELQKDLEGVDHRPPAVLSAVVRQDMLDRQPLGLVEGQHAIIQNIDGRLGKLRGVELPKGKGTVGIDNGLHVDPADPFQGAHQERILAEQVTRVEALDLALPEAGIGLLEEPDLLGGELDVLAVLLFLEAQEPLVLGLHALLEPEVAHRAGADRDPFQPELIGEPQGTPGRMQQ